MDFIAHLRLRQGDMTMTAYAAKLGIDQSTLSKLYSGDRLPGEEVGRRVLTVYPDLIGEWLSFVRSKMTSRHSTVTHGHTAPAQPTAVA